MPDPIFNSDYHYLSIYIILNSTTYWYWAQLLRLYGTQGSLTFENDAAFAGNQSRGVSVGSGPGGAISVHVKGSMYFMGNLNMSDNLAQVSVGKFTERKT